MRGGYDPRAALSPSSMGAGNTTADPASAATTMTGEGSVSVIPVADALDNTPLVKIPAESPTVWRVDHEPHTHHQPDGPWRDPGYQAEGSTDRWGWTET